MFIGIKSRSRIALSLKGSHWVKIFSCNLSLSPVVVTSQVRCIYFKYQHFRLTQQEGQRWEQNRAYMYIAGAKKYHLFIYFLFLTESTTLGAINNSFTCMYKVVHGGHLILTPRVAIKAALFRWGLKVMVFRVSNSVITKCTLARITTWKWTQIWPKIKIIKGIIKLSILVSKIKLEMFYKESASLILEVVTVAAFGQPKSWTRGIKFCVYWGLNLIVVLLLLTMMLLLLLSIDETPTNQIYSKTVCSFSFSLTKSQFQSEYMCIWLKHT